VLRQWRTAAPRIAFLQLVRFQNGPVFLDGRLQCRRVPDTARRTARMCRIMNARS
jgi:hypothetical protein